MIEGIIQGIKYGSSSHRVYARLRADGADGSADAETNVTITIENPEGTVVKSAVNMTQVGSTAVYYYDLDVSTTATWALGYGYQAHIQWTQSSLAREDYIYLDVVRWPFNDPLWTTQEIDAMRPAWAGKKPGSWTTWTEAIEQAHAKFHADLRERRDDKGEPIYPHRILVREQVRQAQLAYILREIALAGVRLQTDDRQFYIDAANGAIPTLITLDRDDDLIDGGADEEAAQATTFAH